MSEQSQGEGWWQASDGKWYPPPRPDVTAGTPPTEPVAPIEPTQPVAGPPPAAPPASGFPPPGGPMPPPGGAMPPPSGMPPPMAAVGGPGTPQRSGLGKGPIIAIVVAALVVVAAVVFFATRDSGSKNNASATRSEQTDSTDSTDSTSSKSSSSSSKTTLPSGFKTISNTTEGVSIGVPNSFTEIDPSTFVNGSDQSDFSSLNPELAPFLSAGNAFLGNSVLGAVGSSNGTPAFLIVAKSPQSFDPTDKSVVSEIESELKSAGLGDITTDNVTLPAGEALRLDVSLNVNTASASGTVSETLFFVTVGRTTWGIVGASVGGSTGNLFDQVARTFTVTA